MAKLTLEQIKERENEINKNLILFAESPFSIEGLQAQKKVLDTFLYLISENQSISGSPRYDRLETHLKQLSKQCDSFLQNPENVIGTPELDNYHSMLEYTQSLAERYLEYKEDPEANTGSALEQARIASVRTVLSSSKQYATFLGTAINESRQEQLFEPGEELVDNQLSFLTNLQRELKASVSFRHPHGEKFGDMMKQLEATIAAGQAAHNRLGEPKEKNAYKDALLELQKKTNAYLAYKKDNNDFGKTSTSRIQMAGRLKLMLQGAVHAMNMQISYKEAPYRTEIAKARKWFRGMEAALKEKGVDIRNQISASSIMIVNPRDDMTSENIDRIAKQIGKVPYEESLAHIPELDHMMQIALAPVDYNGNHLRPLKENENVADWLMREIPNQPQNEAYYGDDHIVHLYRMAKDNRLVLRTNKDCSNEQERYDRITVKRDGTCAVDNAIIDLSSDGTYKDPKKYTEYNITEEEAKKLGDNLDTCHKLLQLRNYMSNLRRKIKADRSLTKEKAISLSARYTNLFTDQGLRIIASDFPNFLSDPKDAHELSIRCDLANDPNHNFTSDEASDAKKIPWSYDYIKAAKKLLKAFNVNSFEELLNRDSFKNEKGEKYTADSAFQFADKIFEDLKKGNRIIYNGERYKMKDLELIKINKPQKGETPKEYLNTIKTMLQDFRGLAGAPGYEPKETLDQRVREWEEPEKARIKKLPNDIKRPMEELYYLVLESYEDEQRLEKAERNLQSHKEEWTYNDILKETEGMKSRVGRIQHTFRSVKKGGLEEQHIGMIDRANQFLDLIDGMSNNINKPITGNGMLSNNIASRLISLHAKKVVMNPDSTEEDFKNELEKLANRKVHIEKRELIKKTLNLDTLVSLGLGQKLMKMDDKDFLTALSSPEKIMEFMKKNGPQKTSQANDLQVKNDLQNQAPGIND